METEARMCDHLPGRLLPDSCRKRKGKKLKTKEIRRKKQAEYRLALRFAACWRSVLGEQVGRESYRRAVARSR